jgi:hypothetical protein
LCSVLLCSTHVHTGMQPGMQSRISPRKASTQNNSPKQGTQSLFGHA